MNLYSRQTYLHCNGFVWIKPGVFIMGDENEKEDGFPHEVRLTKGFYICDHPVTVKEYRQYDTNVTSYKCDDLNCPVVEISWRQAKAYIDWLNDKDPFKGEMRYDLPTEAQWEYACRSGTTTLWFFGDNEIKLKKYAWNKENSEKHCHPVKLKAPNHWGLYDMLGNVNEWIKDAYQKDGYKNHSKEDPFNSKGISRVHRGGSWNDEPRKVCCAFRDDYTQVDADFDIGFRLVKTVF